MNGFEDVANQLTLVVVKFATEKLLLEFITGGKMIGRIAKVEFIKLARGRGRGDRSGYTTGATR